MYNSYNNNDNIIFFSHQTQRFFFGGGFDNANLRLYQLIFLKGVIMSHKILTLEEAFQLTQEHLNDPKWQANPEAIKSEQEDLNRLLKEWESRNGIVWHDWRINPHFNQTYWAVEFRIVRFIVCGVDTFKKHYKENNVWLEESHANELIDHIRKNTFPAFTKEKYKTNEQIDLFEGTTQMKILK